jgi:hypothetical protein
MCPSNHAQHIVEILQPPFFLASLVFWLFLTSILNLLTVILFPVVLMLIYNLDSYFLKEKHRLWVLGSKENFQTWKELQDEGTDRSM